MVRNITVVILASLVGVVIAFGVRALGKRAASQSASQSASTSAPEQASPAPSKPASPPPAADPAVTLADLVRAGFADAHNEVCPVMGKPVPEGEPTFLAYHGTVVRFCCAGCDAGFLDDVAGNLKKVRDTGGTVAEGLLDAAPAVVQAGNERCPVSGRPITGKGRVERVIVERGVAMRVCCSGCLAKVHDEPTRYLREAAKSGTIPAERLR